MFYSKFLNFFKLLKNKGLMLLLLVLIFFSDFGLIVGGGKVKVLKLGKKFKMFFVIFWFFWVIVDEYGILKIYKK